MLKYTSLGILLLSVLFSSHAQQLPPGIVQVDSLYIDQSEVTNVNWLEYLHYLRKDSTNEAYLAALPDSTVWYDVYDSAIAEPLVKSGYRFAGFRYMPIVGISQRQASDYCRWRTQAVKDVVLSNSDRYKISNFSYRLPSEEEWTYIAIRNQTFQNSFVSKKLLKSRIPKKSEIKALGDELKYEVDPRVTKKEIKQFYTENPLLLLDNLNTEDNPYFKTLVGVGIGAKHVQFYDVKVENLRGNVSEMTLTPGIARGGNWTLTEKESAINVKIEYNKPSALLGFRCLCEVDFME